jgi:protein SPIRAL1 and related proteins
LSMAMGRGRGVSYGGGQSSLDYLFGGGAAPAKPATTEQKPRETVTAAAPTESSKMKEVAAGVRGSQTNNYFRAQGQNCGNFLTVGGNSLAPLSSSLAPMNSSSQATLGPW